MIKQIDYITYEYNTVYQIFYDLLKNYVQKDKNGNPNISLLQTDKILSYIHQDKTGLIKYPFVTLQYIPNTKISTGGQYDYQMQGNQLIKLKYYESENYNLLFNQNISLRIQQDNFNINVNIWQYSYQEIQLLRDIIQRTFTLPKKISKTIDLTQYIKEQIDTNDRIASQLLDNLLVTYNIPVYLNIGGSLDSTPATISNELPIKKFTFTIIQDIWQPTDIQIPDINELIEDIRLTFYMNNIQEPIELIQDKIQQQKYLSISSEYKIINI